MKRSTLNISKFNGKSGHYILRINNISQALNGKRKKAGGYIWKYSEDIVRSLEKFKKSVEVDNSNKSTLNNEIA